MPFPIIAILVRVAIAVVLTAVSARAAMKATQKTEAQEAKTPESDAGRTVPVLFGTKRIRGLVVLHASEKTTEKQSV